MKQNILLIDDDISLRAVYSTLLKKEGFGVKAVSSGEEGVAILRQGISQFSLAIVDFHIPQGMNGAETIRQLRELDEKMIFCGLSGDDSDLPFTGTLDAGALVFVQKGIRAEKFVQQIKVLAMQYENQNGKLQYSSDNLIPNTENIKKIGAIGKSQRLAEVAEQVVKFAPYSTTVLIHGENGTGKEMIARALHNLSQICNGPFISVNCGAIPADLFESEIFGHEKGSFTGAMQSKMGLFLAANNGTLFLDEIGELPLSMQVKLLRVIQEREIRPVGSNKNISVNVRLVAATNRNLKDMVESQKFREDLLYRINSVTVTLPPLRERIEDIDLLVPYFADKISANQGVQKCFHPGTLKYLKMHSWPGNIRELENFVEKLLIKSDGNTVTADLVARELGFRDEDVQTEETIKSIADLKAFSEKKEKEFILVALRNAKNNVAEAANKLHLKRTTLVSKMKSLNIELELNS